MVRLTVALGAASARSVQDLLVGLRFLITGTQLEPGCKGCSAWSEPDSTVHYMEAWETEVDMRRRIRSSRFTSLLAIIESAREPRSVEFQFVAQSRGIDYIEEIRAGDTSCTEKRPASQLERSGDGPRSVK